MALFPHPNSGKVCLLLSELCSLALECLSAPRFPACLGYWNYLRGRFKLKQMRRPSGSLLFLSPPVFLLQCVPCGLDSLLAAWDISLCFPYVTLSILWFILYLKIENFHIFTHYCVVVTSMCSLYFLLPTVPSDRSSRPPEVPAVVFLVVLVKSVTPLEALLILEDE